MVVYKKLKSILLYGMLFLCNPLCAYGFPEILTDTKQKKYRVQFLEQGDGVCLVELIPINEPWPFTWKGFLFKNKSLKKEYSELFYAYTQKDIFYFDCKEIKKCSHRLIQRTNTFYENEVTELTPVFSEDK